MSTPTACPSCHRELPAGALRCPACRARVARGVDPADTLPPLGASPPQTDARGARATRSTMDPRRRVRRVRRGAAIAAVCGFAATLVGVSAHEAGPGSPTPAGGSVGRDVDTPTAADDYFSEQPSATYDDGGGWAPSDGSVAPSAGTSPPVAESRGS